MAWGAEWGSVQNIQYGYLKLPVFQNILLIQSNPGDFFYRFFVGSNHAAGSYLNRVNLAASTDTDYKLRDMCNEYYGF